MSALTLFGIDNTYAQRIRYVKVTATGNGSGDDWNNASADLQGMITASSANDQVWVAAGRYMPASGSSFSMKEGVAVYGGFAGSEQSLHNRPEVNPVIGSPSGTTLAGNGSRVINNPASLSLTNMAVLDGFEITGGGNVDQGGGMYNRGCSPALRNCSFSQNTATGSGAYGGAMYNFSGSSPVLTNCLFSQNSTVVSGNGFSYGGAMYNFNNCNPVLTNCLFSQNSSSSNSGSGGGGAMYNASSCNPLLINCSLVENTVSGRAFSSGGAIYNFTSCSPLLINSSFSRNATLGTASFKYGGALYNFNGSNPEMINSILFDNGGTNAIYNYDDGSFVTATYSLFEDGATGFTSDPTNITGVTTSPFAGTATTQPAANSPGKNNGYVAGYTAVSGPPMDLAGNPRFVGAGYAIDMGAYEDQTGSPSSVLIVQQPSAASAVCTGSTVAVTVSATGTAPAYQWYKDGTALTGIASATTASLQLSNVSVANAGSYSVVVTGGGGVSVTSTAFSLTVNAFPSLTITAAPSLTILNDNSVTLTASGAGSYSWSTGASTSVISASLTGTYSVTGINNGCSSSTSVVVKGQYTIGDRIYFDINGNGIQNAGEPGIPGTIINAVWFGPNNTSGGGDDVPYSTTTGADGIWSLTVLDIGTYRITATPPANQGWISTDAFDNGILSAANPVTPLITASRNDIDFGFRSTGQASGLVFRDIDRSGVQNLPAGEQGLSGVTVRLRYDANANGTLTDTDDGLFTGVTNAAGVYSFSLLPPGTYQAELLTAGLPGNSLPTYDPDGVATPYSTTLTLTTGQSLTTVNFGYATVCYPVIYVTQAGAGNRDGSSWSNAYSGTALQTAIDAAAGCSGQVWVATGTYKPTTATGPDSRTVSFAMRNNVAIYGGFLGSETALSGRQTVNPVTGTPSSSTLSGDIGTIGNNSDNSYHVIHNTQSLTLNQSAVIDGFVITGGNGNSIQCPDYYGAAIHNDGASPTIRNCLFTGNNGGWGGAVMNRLRYSNGSLELTTPVITSCVFSSNTAGGGGGVFNLYSRPEISNVIFRNNYASNGGAMYNRGGGAPQVVNSTFVSNSALSGGAIFSQLASTPQLTNCSFRDNTASTEGGVLYNDTYYNGSSATLVNCVLYNNGGSHSFYNAAPQSTTQLSSVSLTYSLFEPASVSTTGVDVSGPGNLTTSVSPFDGTTGTELAACSPAINAGLNAATGLTGVLTDLAGNPRRYQNGVVDMGAYEFQGGGLPANFTVLCSGTATCAASPTVTLSGSETGVSYQLQRDGVNTGTAVTGTGSAISFGPQSLSGIYTVIATGSGSCTVAMATAATVVSSTAAISVTAPVIATGTAGVAFNQSFTASGGNSPYTFAILQGTLPTGLTLNPDGQFNGVPVQSGPFAVTVLVSDAGTCSLLSTYSLTINCPSLTVNTPTVATATVGLSVQDAFIWYITGASTYSFAFGELPPGLSVAGVSDNYRRIYGTPTQVGVFPVSLTLTNEYSCSFVAPPFNITVNCPSLTVNTPTVATVAAGEGVNGYDFGWFVAGAGSYSSAFSGLPPGFFVDSPGPNYWRLIGTPSQAGVFPVSLTLTNEYGCSFVTPPFEITVNCPSLTVATPVVAIAAVGEMVPGNSFEWGLTSTSSYSSSFSGLPPGLSVSSPGPNYWKLLGTPTQAGVFSVSLTLTSDNGCTFVVPPFSITVNCATMSVSTTANPATCGATGSISFSTTLPDGSYSLSYTGSGSPKTVSVSEGAFSLTGLTAGTYSSFSLSQPGLGCVLQEDATVSLTNPAAPTPVMTANNGGTLTCAQTSLTLTASGGNSYTFARSGGGGIVSQNAAAGTAVVNMSGTYSVTVANAAGCTSQTSITIGVDNSVPSLGITPSSVTLTCTSPSAVLSVIGTGDVHWSTGAVSNTISVVSAGTYSVTLTSGNGCTNVSSATVVSATAAPALTINPSTAIISCASPTVSLSAIGDGTVRWSTVATGPVLSVTAAGSYIVSLTNINGCTASATAIVSGTLLGAATVTDGGSLGCGVTTTTVQVQASGATSFTLLGPSGFSAVNSSGVFSVTAGGSYTGLAGQSGCVVSNTAMVVEGGAQPTISSVQATGTLGNGACSVSVQGSGYGDRYVLTGPSGYVFSVVYRTAGVHTALFPNVIKPGTYTLTVYSGSCVVTQTVVVSGTACP